jgi:hypothetical protein
VDLPHLPGTRRRSRRLPVHPDFDGDYDPQDVWFVLDQMTRHRYRDELVIAHLNRIQAGLPPRGMRNSADQIAVLHTEAALITSYYYAVSDDTTTAQQQLQSQAHRLIQQHTGPKPPPA